jgi:hypothetical protein
MIGPRLDELAQVAEQENMNRALARQADRRARQEAKDRGERRRRTFPWHLWDGSPEPGRQTTGSTEARWPDTA